MEHYGGDSQQETPFSYSILSS